MCTVFESPNVTSHARHMLPHGSQQQQQSQASGSSSSSFMQVSVVDSLADVLPMHVSLHRSTAIACQAMKKAKESVKKLSEKTVKVAMEKARASIQALAAIAGGAPDGKRWSADVKEDTLWPAVIQIAAYHFSKDGRIVAVARSSVAIRSRDALITHRGARFGPLCNTRRSAG